MARAGLDLFRSVGEVFEGIIKTGPCHATCRREAVGSSTEAGYTHVSRLVFLVLNDNKVSNVNGNEIEQELTSWRE